MNPIFKFDMELFDEIGVRSMAIYDFLECVKEGRYPQHSYHLENHEQAVFDDKKIEKSKKDEFLVLIMNELFEMLVDAVDELKLDKQGDKMEKRKFDGSSADFKELIGCVIDEVYLNNNRDEVYFKVGHDSWLKYSADGYCCSNSWFESVDVPSEKPMKVFEVLEREMPKDSWGEGGHECVAFYGWSIVTNQGYLDVEMRNSSNGYYGGSVRFCGKLSPELDKKKKEEEIKKKEEEKFTILRSIYQSLFQEFLFFQDSTASTIHSQSP